MRKHLQQTVVESAAHTDLKQRMRDFGSWSTSFAGSEARGAPPREGGSRKPVRNPPTDSLGGKRYFLNLCCHVPNLIGGCETFLEIRNGDP